MNASADVEPAAGEYVSAAAITRATGVTLTKLYGAVVRDEVRRILPPGRPPRYSLEDARRLAVQRPGTVDQVHEPSHPGSD